MTKKDIIRRFCALSSKVAGDEFGHRVAADCFCRKQSFGFSFESQVIEFIEKAVEQALGRNKG